MFIVGIFAKKEDLKIIQRFISYSMDLFFAKTASGDREWDSKNIQKLMASQTGYDILIQEIEITVEEIENIELPDEMNLRMNKKCPLKTYSSNEHWIVLYLSVQVNCCQGL